MRNRSRGVLVLHVDNGLLCGNGECYEASLGKLQRRAPLKIWKNQGTERGPWLPGMQVYFRRRAGLIKEKSFKGRVRQHPDRWIGPGIVLAVEG